MYIADLHIHSKYSRATSKDMTPEILAKYAKEKGVSLLGTGDAIHPKYLEELKEKLKPTSRYGIYEYDGVDFILSGEISNIYSQDGKLRKIHTVLLYPDFESVKAVQKKLAPYGSIFADGRPIFGLSLKKTIELVREVSDEIMIIPAHIWTPWFSLFGSNSGFDSIEECCGELSDEIIALETGLSSDPPMNWRLSALDKYTLVSNSDAHSPSRIGREANVFAHPVDFNELREILKNEDSTRFLFTIEFFPEEGKYHYDGHRNCKVSLHPRESIKLHNVCPVCGRPLTVGVLHRVEDLADRPEGFRPPGKIGYKNLVPLDEIIADALEVGKESKRVRAEYENMVKHLGPELEILLQIPYEDMEGRVNEKIIEGIRMVREGKVKVVPGYDGVYGKIEIFPKQETKQMSLF